MVDFEVVVVVPGLPGAVPDLDEAHAALDQPAGDQDLPRLHAVAVQLADVLRFARDVEGVGRLDLHAVGQLERLDPRLELRVVLRAAAGAVRFSSSQQVELPSLQFGGDRVGLRMFSISLFDRSVLRVDVGALETCPAGSRPASSATPGSDSRPGTWR